VIEVSTIVQGFISIGVFGLTLFILKNWLNGVQAQSKEAIDKLEKKIDRLGTDLRQEHDSWDGRRETILRISSEVCQTRQNACSSLLSNRLDNICKKIDNVKEAREQAWTNHREMHRQNHKV